MQSYFYVLLQDCSSAGLSTVYGILYMFYGWALFCSRNSTSHKVEVLRCMAMIGIDLLKEVTQPKRNNLLNVVPAAVNLQLSIMSIFLQEDQRSSRAKSKQTEEIVLKMKCFVWDWIRHLQSGSYEWDDFIQVSTGSQFRLFLILPWPPPHLQKCQTPMHTQMDILTRVKKQQQCL